MSDTESTTPILSKENIRQHLRRFWRASKSYMFRLNDDEIDTLIQRAEIHFDNANTDEQLELYQYFTQLSLLFPRYQALSEFVERHMLENDYAGVQNSVIYSLQFYPDAPLSDIAQSERNDLLQEANALFAHQSLNDILTMPPSRVEGLWQRLTVDFPDRDALASKPEYKALWLASLLMPETIATQLIEAKENGTRIPQKIIPYLSPATQIKLLNSEHKVIKTSRYHRTAYDFLATTHHYLRDAMPSTSHKISRLMTQDEADQLYFRTLPKMSGRNREAKINLLYETRVHTDARTLLFDVQRSTVDAYYQKLLTRLQNPQNTDDERLLDVLVRYQQEKAHTPRQLWEETVTSNVSADDKLFLVEELYNVYKMAFLEAIKGKVRDELYNSIEMSITNQRIMVSSANLGETFRGGVAEASYNLFLYDLNLRNNTYLSIVYGNVPHETTHLIDAVLQHKRILPTGQNATPTPTEEAIAHYLKIYNVERTNPIMYTYDNNHSLPIHEAHAFNHDYVAGLSHQPLEDFLSKTYAEHYQSENLNETPPQENATPAPSSKKMDNTPRSSTLKNTNSDSNDSAQSFDFKAIQNIRSSRDSKTFAVKNMDHQRQ